MATKLILLDGARGAGKSTVSKLLEEKLENTAFVGLDLIRNLMKGARATNEFNEIAFDAIFSLTRSFLSHGVYVVIDSGLTQDRVEKLRSIAKENNSNVFQYTLYAPREVLWERIQKRGVERNKMPNRERFDYTFDAQQAKDFSGFIKIDTTALKPDETVEKILSDILPL